MKSKKRHHSSSEDSDESNVSEKSSSSSDSETDDSSVSEHRYKKKRKRAESSDSDSNSDDQKRSKKRKHKKKKKKHGKKKRRSGSVERESVESISSLSEGEITSKKKRKHKHKHSKRAADSSPDEEDHQEHRLHSVVKERQPSSEERSQPSRTYYQKEYRHSASVENFDREREVQRFYRGSSKEHRSSYPEQYAYDRDRNERFVPYPADKYEKNRERYGQNSHFVNPHADYNRRHKEFGESKRNPRFEDRRPEEDYHRRQREEPYSCREDMRGHNRYNQYEERGAPKRREIDDGRDFRERRGPPEVERYREREYAERREKFHEERYSDDRPREFRRERPPRMEKPHIPHVAQRDHSKSRSPVERFRDKGRRLESREEREGGRPAKERVRGEERVQRDSDDNRNRMRRSEDHPRVSENTSRAREKKSRFADADDKKEYDWGKVEVKKEDKNAGEKEKPNFGLSGKLTADTNTVNGVVIKYSEPDDAKQPKRRWRFYPFKGDKALPILYIHRQSCFLIGRDKKVVDISLEHPSISKQHAALQYRATPFTRTDGTQGRRVRPYIIDLESANGTFVNNKKVEPRRYVELLERDVVKFGFSQREYVLLHENSKDDAQDDDNQELPAVGAGIATTDQIKQEKRIKEEMAADGE